MAGASVAPKSARIARGGGQLSGHWSENEGQFRVELQDKVTKIKYEYLKMCPVKWSVTSLVTL